MKQIFPKEIIENTIEVHRFKHQIKSEIIYTILLLSVFGMGISLPYLFIDIYSSSRGIIKPEKERNQLTSLYSGKIKATFIKENNFVYQGDTLMIIDNAINEEKLYLVLNQLEETKLKIRDLTYLSTIKNINNDSIQTFLYQKEYLQYAQKISELKTKNVKSKKDFNRQSSLYQKDVISKVDYENSKYNFDLTISNFTFFERQQRSIWQTELTNQIWKLKELTSALLQYQKDQHNYIITASVDGTIQNLKGLEVDNFITAGNVFAEISPSTKLVGECYVSPSDIGLLKTNSDVKFQIDAYNYNQWGMASGKITSISKDISMINNLPMFKIICAIDQKNLKLKNGFEGNLKRGMTFNARFFIANRSAFELLYDKVDDWFNPSKINN